MDNEIVVPVMDKVIYTTDSYEVRITEIIEQQSKQPLIVYGIFNRATGVREAELRGYPHVIKWTDQLQEQVDGMYAERSKQDAERAAIEAALGRGADEQVEAVEEQDVFDLPEPMSKEEAQGELEGLLPDAT